MQVPSHVTRCLETVFWRAQRRSSYGHQLSKPRHYTLPVVKTQTSYVCSCLKLGVLLYRSSKHRPSAPGDKTWASRVTTCQNTFVSALQVGQVCTYLGTALLVQHLLYVPSCRVVKLLWRWHQDIVTLDSHPGRVHLVLHEGGLELCPQTPRVFRDVVLQYNAEEASHLEPGLREGGLT